MQPYRTKPYIGLGGYDDDDIDDDDIYDDADADADDEV